MNDLESQIVSALAPWRGPETPRYSKLATGQDRGHRGTRSPLQNRPADQSPALMGSADYGGDLRSPWPDRPRFAGRRTISTEAARAVAKHPAVLAFAVLFAASGILRALHDQEAGVRVVVHTLWPL